MCYTFNVNQYGVRHLKQSTSRVLGEVKNGSIVEITEWGETIAKIIPFKRSNIEELIKAGLITPPRDKWHNGSKRLKLKGNKTTTEILSELRDEER